MADKNKCSHVDALAESLADELYGSYLMYAHDGRGLSGEHDSVGYRELLEVIKSCILAKVNSEHRGFIPHYHELFGQDDRILITK